MYLPISTRMLDKIEIEIKDEAGNNIIFPYGSKSSVTVHFRKIKMDD